MIIGSLAMESATHEIAAVDLVLHAPPVARTLGLD